MDLTIDLNVIMQGFLAASLLWYARSVREMVTIVKIHDYRIERLEQGGITVSTNCPV